MAATSNAFNACNAGMTLADSTGVDWDIAFTAANFKISRSRKVAEYTVFGDPETYRMTCKKDGSASLTAICSTDVKGAYLLLEEWHSSGGARRAQFMIPQNQIGGTRYDAYFILESLDIEGSADDAGPMKITASLKPSGGINRTVIVTS